MLIYLINSYFIIFILYSNNRTIAEPTSRLSDEPFVSANDNASTNTSTPTSLQKQDSIESPIKDVGHRKRNSKSLPLRNDGSLDYDGKDDIELH